MADNQEKTLDLNAIDLEKGDTTNEGIRAIIYCVRRLKEAYGNTNFQATVQAQMQASGLIPPQQVQEERARSLEREESPRRDLSKEGQKSSPTRRRRSSPMANPRTRRREYRQRDDDEDLEVRDKEDSLGHSSDDVSPRRT